MELVHGFNASGVFYDDLNFPHGFSKSGFFSIPESEMLEKLGRRLIALDQGTAQPETEVEESFVEFCNNDSAPETRVQRVWAKYKKHSQRKSTMTLGSSDSGSSDKESYEEDRM